MRPVWLILGLMGAMSLLPGSLVVQAQDRRFPYEAVIDVDQEFVRCGPGPKYYPTSKLERGARVIVHRHDPGGWAMIAPPADSFSWIQADYVQKAASGRGSLTSNNVIVHVGSNLGHERSVYQRTLSRGDTVEVLGEQTIVSERGPARMYKIKPPPREYRWIAAKSIVPAGSETPAVPRPRPLKPNQPAPFIQGPIATELETEVAAVDEAFSSSTAAAPMTPGTMPASPISSTSEIADSFEEQETTPVPALKAEDNPTLENLRADLAALDQKFRTILQSEPRTWDLESLKTDYIRLEKAAQHPAFTSHVNQRLGTLKRYARIQADYIEFYRLTTQTQRRDAELLAQQQQNLQRLQQAETLAQNASAGPAIGLDMPGNAPRGLQPIPVTQSRELTALIPGTPPEGGAMTSGPQSAHDVSPPSNTKPATTPRRFSGAGIVQRSTVAADGVPAFMLMAPDGRLLAYLEAAPGVDLNRMENQALGIVGERGFREHLQADVIVVRGVQPIVLKATPVRQ